jgi:seryl-tRNA synthetase
MLDLKAIRSAPDEARSALARRRDGSEERLARVLELDERRRAILPELEGLRREQNLANERIGEARKAGDDPAEMIAAMKNIGARQKLLDGRLKKVQEELDQALRALPNLPSESAADEDTVLREVGEAGKAGKDHLDLVGAFVDLESGAKVSGSRFAYLRGPLVMLELALVRWALGLLVERGFEPVVPPVLVREEALFGTGFLPDTEQQIYRVPEDDLYLVGTSEVPLAGLHMGDMLEEGDLPARYAGFSPCFRREAGAAGRDTRGLFRVHQFDKVEMFSFVRPEDGLDEHERILSIEEEIMGALGLPYRVVNIAVGDLGSSAAKKYDLEVWLPGQERYRELTSCSNTTDYQARRLDARYRPEGGGSPRHVHTLNGTAVAVGRTIIALVENGQQEDGSIVLPEALAQYGGPTRLEPAS